MTTRGSSLVPKKIDSKSTNHNTLNNLNKSEKNIDQKHEEETMELTPIQAFYEHQTIFITGGTGFIGKVLIEKLLRCCSRVSRIYVLIREKRGKDVSERLRNLLEDTVFDNLRSSVPNFAEKIVGIAGDCSQENLGISDDDIMLLKENVSIIFHCAATVRCDEKLKVAVATNIQSTVTITEFCKNMKSLKVFIYASTAFAHCLNNPNIEEKFYDYTSDYKYFLFIAKSFNEDVIETISPILTKSWLNTYTCTKALAENFLKTENQNLPIAIFRSVMLTPSAYEPIPGWVDNYDGATGIIAGAVSGVMRTLHCDPEKRANVVPVDFTVNALIACAWDLATREGNRKLIYNYTSSGEAPITWKKILELGWKHNEKYPLNTSLWYPCLRMTKYEFVYKFCKLFLHQIPAFVVDLVAQGIGREPKMAKLYEKVHKMCDSLKYVTMNEWDVKNDNVQDLWNKLDRNDRSIFKFTMQGFDWDEYISNYVKGVRIYLFKDNLETLDASRKRYKRLFWMDRFLKVAFAISMYYTLRKIWQMRRTYKTLNKILSKEMLLYTTLIKIYL